MTMERAVLTTTVETAEWQPDEETGGLVHLLRADESVEAGVWQAGPAAGRTIEVELIADEALIVLAGSARLEVDDEPAIELRAGVMVSLRKGARTRWVADSEFREFWVYAKRS